MEKSRKLCEKGKELLGKKMYAEAEKHFAEAVSKDATFAEAWILLGNSLFYLEKYDRTIECCNLAINLGTLDIRAWQNKAAALYELEEYQEALECCDKAIELEPMEMHDRELKCLSYRKLGQYDRALKCVRDAITNLEIAALERHAEMIRDTAAPININMADIRWKNKFKAFEAYFKDKIAGEEKAEVKMSGTDNFQIKLEVIKGPEKGKVFVLNEPTTCLAGRSREARFRFGEDDPYISRRHFLLEVAPPKVYFRDLDVTNSSKVNDRIVEEEILSDGDIIEVGYTQLKVFINLALKAETLHCAECGKSFEIYDDESPAQVCADCLTDVQEEQRRQDALKVEGPFKARCQCGKDLTNQANSDGRARELAGKVTYACEKCMARLKEDKGQKIDHYELIKFLGKGGMGQVYLAWHKPTVRIVAFKEMNIPNDQLAARFAREIRIMKKVAHENVLCFIDSGQSRKSGKPYLTMEYASGGCLEDLVKGNGSLPAGSIVEFIIKSLDGLKFIHRAGIVHRDLKPENILLKGNGGEELVPKIADFGLSREFSRAGGSQLTQLGTALGTVLYMPPEQIMDAHNVKETADVYSMGATLYYLLSGRYPFNFPTKSEVQQFFEENKKKVRTFQEAFKLMIEIKKLKTPHLIVLTEEPVPIRKRCPQIHPGLARIVDNALKKDASRRFQTADDFKRELERIVAKL
jgi:serine/threonine-protein kinase